MTKRKAFGPRSLRSSFSELGSKTPLDLLLFDTAEEWYGAKHPPFSAEEIALVNSVGASECPFCHSASFRKDGKRADGTQRYLCLRCKKRFNPLTGSVFDSRKIPISEWIEFLIHLFQYESLYVSSIDNRNSPSTGRYWTKKVFEVLRGYQDGIILGDRFWIDETYLRKEPSETSKDPEGRKLRGLSHDKFCVATATDGRKAVLIVMGCGKPSSSRMLKALSSHIKPSSTMVDDKEKAHLALAESLGLARESHPSAKLKNLADEDNPMNEVNTVHRLFKKFMSRHGSYDRSDLQSWCDLFAFIFAHHGNVAEMVRDFLKLAISTKKVLRFRDVMNKKP